MSIDSLSDNKSISQRNKLIFKLLYESGMRISELLGLRLVDYSEPDPSENVGTIYIRNHKPLYHKDHSLKTTATERDIPVSMDLIFEIDDYVLYGRPQLGEIDSIFVNHSSRNMGNFLTRRPIEKVFLQLSEFSGVKCTPHMLRHTHGTELKESGYSEIYIMDRLGHSSVESTRKICIYHTMRKKKPIKALLNKGTGAY